MDFDAIIFDLDGTVINTEPVYEKANKILLESKGIILDNEASKNLQAKLHGTQIDLAGKIIKSVYDLKETEEEIATERTDLVKKFYESGIKFVDGFVEFHKKVEKLNLKSAIATNVNYATLAAAKRGLDLTKFFGPHMYCIEDVNYVGKPAPDIYLYAADQLGVLPQNCVVIEDSSCGIQAAKSAGMFCIGINTNGSRQLLKDADLIVDSYNQIDLESLLDTIF